MNKEKMQKVMHKTNLYLRHYSPTILTCIGSLGVVLTTVTAVKATPKAIQLLNEATDEKGEPLTKFEIVNVAGPVYIPSVIIGISTIACIFGANVLNKRYQASLTSAYGLLDSSFKKYKNKVKELYGDDVDKNIRNSIAIDKFRERDCESVKSEVLFYDEFTDQFFESTMDKVLMAEYQLNRDLAIKGFVMLNEFYAYLGLSPVENGDAFGWSLDAGNMFYGYSWIDFEHIKVEAEDENDPDYCEFYRLVMKTEPAIDYDIITDQSKEFKNRLEMRRENEKKEIN